MFVVVSSEYWHWKRPLYQLSHNRARKNIFYHCFSNLLRRHEEGQLILNLDKVISNA